MVGSGCILKVEVAELAAGLGIRCKLKRGVKNYSKVFGLND